MLSIIFKVVFDIANSEAFDTLITDVAIARNMWSVFGVLNLTGPKNMAARAAQAGRVSADSTPPSTLSTYAKELPCIVGVHPRSRLPSL